ncbi:MAG: helix-turn-helix transcriptional regulator [Oscillospiraceae bacterium]|nr:helix-turn-helix transcriptional regulator [Oscillospiraceae bacterium]
MVLAKEPISFKNRDRFIQLGIAIAALRKMRGMSQDQLAEKANISRSHLSAIEAPNMVRAFSMEAFYNIADALEVDPAELINAAIIPEHILNKK